MARVVAVAPEHVGHLRLDDVQRTQAHGRIQVPLEDGVGSESEARHVQRNPPVHPDHVSAGIGHEVQDLAGTDAEVDAGNPGVGHALEHATAEGQDAAFVDRRAECPGPAVEELDGRCPAVDL